jgi:DNA-binding HxlR family transcriptional regulator
MFHCPVEATLSLIGGKYKPIILYHLIGQKLRFSELQRIMPQATQKMLTQQLRELESDGLVHREVFPVVPPKTEYSLTEYGQTLAPVLKSMCDWGNEHLSEYIIPSAETEDEQQKKTSSKGE